jgi:type II secretion system protein J
MQKGFTLLEILLAISLISVMVAISMSVLFSSAQISQIVEQKIDVADEALVIIDRLRNEIQTATDKSSRSLLKLSGVKKVGNSYLEYLGDQTSRPNSSNMLRFVSSGTGAYIPGSSSTRTVIEIRYRLEKNPDNPSGEYSYVLVRDELPLLEGEIEANKKKMTFPISNHVTALNFRFFSFKKELKSWQNTWGDQSSGNIPLPSLVELSLTIALPGASMRSYSTIVPLN